jgi:hypothetical protein
MQHMQVRSFIKPETCHQPYSVCEQRRIGGAEPAEQSTESTSDQCDGRFLADLPTTVDPTKLNDALWMFKTPIIIRRQIWRSRPLGG